MNEVSFEMASSVLLLVKEHGVEHGPRLMLVTNGLTLFYDKLWFPGEENTDGYRVAGKDWETTIAGGRPYRVPLTHRLSLTIDGKVMPVFKFQIIHPENMARDIALLRMFGVEKLFSNS